MGKGNRSAHRNRSKTLPSSPSHSFSSSSSSDFEFTIAISPRNKSSTADELFYKGQLLPLHLSPRISMVRTLQFLSSSSASTSVTTSRDSTGSTDSSTSSASTSSSHLALLAAAAAAAAASTSTTCDSFRSNSITDDDGHHEVSSRNSGGSNAQTPNKKLSNKYFSLSRFSNVFKNNNSASNAATSASTVESNSKCGGGDSSGRYVESGSGSGTTAAGRRKVASSVSAKEVIRKYLKKVKPLYEKLSAYHTVKQQQQNQRDHTSGKTKTINEAPASSSSLLTVVDRPSSCSSTKRNNTSSTRPALGLRSQSSLGDLEIALLPGNSSNSSCRSSSSSGADFVTSSLSENLRYLSMRRSSKRSYVASCPSSMRSSPNHSGILNRAGLPAGHRSGDGVSAGSSNINGCSGSNGTTIKTASSGYSYSGTSTMEELQSAIQGAIAHCKNSMLQNSPCNNNGKGPAAATDVASTIGCASSSRNSVVGISKEV